MRAPLKLAILGTLALACALAGISWFSNWTFSFDDLLGSQTNRPSAIHLTGSLGAQPKSPRINSIQKFPQPILPNNGAKPTQKPPSEGSVNKQLNLHKKTSPGRKPYGRVVVNCLLRQNTTNSWKFLVQNVLNCANNYSKIRASNFTLFKMGRMHEKKRFLIPKNFADSEMDCRWLTIGIGGDAMVEKVFHKSYPRCKIYGIEPSAEQFGNFGKYGKVIPMAVGLTSGKLEMQIRMNDGKYKSETVDIHPLPQVLDKYVGSRVIQFATLDIEGFEYEILSGLLKPNGVLAKAGVIFCQLDVELHDPSWKPKKFSFDKFFATFLKGTNYVPVFAEKFIGVHHKMILIYGGRDSACDKTFELAKMFV